MLTEDFRVLIEHFLEGLAQHSGLSRYDQPCWHLDESFILVNVRGRHAPRILVIATAEHDWVLDLGVLDAVIVTPLEELVELILLLLGCARLQVVRVVFALLRRLCHALDSIKELQEAKLGFDVHFKIIV